MRSLHSSRSGASGASRVRRVKAIPSAYIWTAALLAWMGVIFVLSHQPGTGSDWEPPLWYVVERKSAHVFEYAVLASLAIGCFRSWYRDERFSRILLLAWVLAVAYGCVDEVHQSFVFGRGARLTDVMFDAVGATAAIALAWWARRTFPFFRPL